MLPFRTYGLLVGLLLTLSCGKGEAPRPLQPLPLLVVHVERPPVPVEEEEPPPPPPPPQDGFQAFARAARAAEERYDADYPYYGVAFHLLAQVFQEPRTDAPIFGYMRRGSRFRAGQPVRGAGCEGRFYPVEGGGYVCDRRGFILGKTLKSFSPAPEPPDLHASLPYVYAKTLSDGVPQYYRLPTEEEERAAHTAVAELRRLQAEAAAAKAEQSSNEEVAATLDAGADGGAGEAFDVLPDYVRMAMRPGFYVSLDGVETAPSGKEFARTVRGAYVELEKLKEATPSPYHGQVLHDGLRRPLGLVHFAEAKTMVRDVDQGRFVPGPGLPRFGAVWLTGDKINVGRLSYLGTEGGAYVDARAVRVARTQTRPQLVPRSGRWIDVDLDQQILVAYEGDMPVFATLVATGKPGFDTPTGLFRIHAKHVSTTMDGADGTDEMYSIEDVPWTMYFQGSLALHGAFWHDRFGRVRSHGCVNLSPSDARHLFEWATPVAPPGFHGVNTDLRKHGTYVNVHAS